MESLISELKETSIRCGLDNGIVSVTGGGGMRGGSEGVPISATESNLFHRYALSAIP